MSGGERLDRWSGLGPLRGAGGERFARGLLGGLTLTLVCLAVYLPGLWSIPTIDRDEARFAQASRQMFESVALDASARDERPLQRTEDGQLRAGPHAGGLVAPMVQDRPRLNKPPLIYWLQSGSAFVLTGGDPARDAIWMYRLPSVLGAIVACLATWRLGLLLVDARAAWLGGVLLGVCPLVVWDAHQARADQALLAFTTLAMWALTRIWTRREVASDWWTTLAFWGAIGAGMLTKGPVTPLVVLLTALGVSVIAGEWRWLRRTHPLIGLVVLTAMLAPWLIGIGQRVGWGLLWEIAFDETLGRSSSPKEGHWGPPGYHLVLLAVLFWPGSMLTMVAFVRTWRLAVRLPESDGGWGERVRSLPARWRERVVGRDAEVLLLAWVVPSWVVFELVSTKLPHYTMPLYPALALMSAAAVIDAARKAMDSDSFARLRLGLRIWGAIGILLCVVLPVVVALLGGGWVAITCAAVGAGACLVLMWRTVGTFDHHYVLAAQGAGVLASVIFAWTFLQFVLPRARAVWITPRLVASIREAEMADAPVANVGYHEDSLIFATRGRAQRLEASAIPSWTRRHPDGVLIVPEGLGVDLGASRWEVFDRVQGFNYAGGRAERLELLRRD
ncbi:MAG: ArnT family glycosyltransferase [Phycisphaerales bacterium JB059]